MTSSLLSASQDVRTDEYCHAPVLLFCTFMIVAAYALATVVAISFCSTFSEERRDRLYKSSD